MSSAARARQSEQAVRHRSSPAIRVPDGLAWSKTAPDMPAKQAPPAFPRGRSAGPLVGSFAELQMEQYRRSALRAVEYLGPRTAAREHRDVLRFGQRPLHRDRRIVLAAEELIAGFGHYAPRSRLPDAFAFP